MFPPYLAFRSCSSNLPRAGLGTTPPPPLPTENLTNASLAADLSTQAVSFKDLQDGDTWQPLNKLWKNDFLKRHLPDYPDFPPVHKHLCSGFGVGLEVEREQDGLIPLTTGTGGGGVGIHRAGTMLTRGSSVGSRVLRLKQTSPHSQANPCATLRVLGRNAPCSPHCSNLTSSKRALCYTKLLSFPAPRSPG